MLRRLLISAAFATWCFLNIWIQIGQDNPYFARYNPVTVLVIPALCWEAIITAAIFLGWLVCSRAGWLRNRFTHYAFLAACVFPALIAAVSLSELSPINPERFLKHVSVWAVGLAAVTTIVIARPKRVSAGIRSILLFSWPVLLFVVVHSGIWRLARQGNAVYRDGPFPARIEGIARTRVVWVIFDELSEGVVFGEHPDDPRFGQFEQLRAASVSAPGAIPPADSTALSLPSLILGQEVSSAVPCKPDEMCLRLAPPADTVGWSSLDNVFDQARRMGFNTAAVGWYHPYGRLFRRSLNDCFWTAAGIVFRMDQEIRPEPLLQAMARRAKLQVESITRHWPGQFGLYRRNQRARRLSYLVTHAKELAADPGLGLVMLHLPIPHPPAIAVPAGNTSNPPGYIDSVGLADRILGQLTGSIAAAGLESRTALIVTSDHGWRVSMWRGGWDWTAPDEQLSNRATTTVPFLLRLPGQSTPVRCGPGFKTVGTARIIREILAGHLIRPDQFGSMAGVACQP